jgi:hypothetical protein
MLSKWYVDHAASRDDVDAHLGRGAEYAARVPPGTTMCHIAADQAFVLFVSGRSEEALTLTNRLIPLAEQAGLEVGRALLLQWRGAARVALGDAGGVADMREMAKTLADHAHEKAAVAYINLAETMRSLGDMAAADAAYVTAAELARRLALRFVIDNVALGQAYQAYHAADWDTAHHLLSQVAATSNQFTENFDRLVRGRISLAHGNAHEALQDATAMISYATSSANDELLYAGLALKARCHHAERLDTDALAACARYLTRWHDTGGMVNRAIELAELTPILVTACRHDDIRDAALPLPQNSRWRDALLLTADHQYAEAADLYTQIGSQPLAADAHLLAATKATAEGIAAHHAHAVLAFAEKTGATLYQRQAEQLVRASA